MSNLIGIVSALCIVLLVANIVSVEGHGMLLNPPARSSAWREDPARFPAYYQDNQMFCGGFNTQWNINNGKCGICGESFTDTKLFEKGGSLYRGFITRSYNQGQLIDVLVEITANHKGFFEFRLCNVDPLAGGEATQSCLDRTILSDTQGRTKFPVKGEAAYKMLTQLVLPPSIRCNHCVIQWRYNTGNSWGTDQSTGQSGMGLGPQEQFMGCSDVSIGPPIKREWSIDAPQEGSRPVLPLHSSQKVAEVNDVDEEEEHASLPKSLLKRLFNELKRLKSIERDELKRRQSPDQSSSSIDQEEDEEREADEMSLREMLPQEVHDLKVNKNAKPKFTSNSAQSESNYKRRLLETLSSLFSQQQQNKKK